MLAFQQESLERFQFGEDDQVGLLQVFPNVEKAYRQQTLGKMMDRQQWSVAATFVGEDSELQVWLGTVVPCACPTLIQLGLTVP